MLTGENILPENAVSIIRGSSKTLQIEVTDSTGKVVDLTGARMIFTAKKSVEDTSPLFQKTSDHSTQITFTNAKGGIAQVYIEYTDTQSLEPADYVFDVWVVLTGGKRYAVIPPTTFVVQPGVTFIP